ncbi:VanZ family protein [Thiomicrorhabdus xiamenensis]|uniref:VanZ family protein n=1 Tax=Thiomicrorhabdus xiamenensis TaxID=2739063 RepID=A0A7D4SZE5_9GAMM|nr:VanZ family protein [Thiomicrorhabdus xiamenensis]QKI88522.1 VanZ family protein [Thiomicrorhabdus xiamenensis]
MRRLWLITGWGLIAGVFYLSVLTPYIPTIKVSNIDKAYHFIAYFALMIWFAQAYAANRRWIILLAIILFGILIEFIQPHYGRDFDIKDMLANSSGALMAWLISLQGGDFLYRRFTVKAQK